MNLDELVILLAGDTADHSHDDSQDETDLILHALRADLTKPVAVGQPT